MCTLLFRFFTRRSALNTVYENLLVEETMTENFFAPILFCYLGRRDLVIRWDGRKGWNEMTGKKEGIRTRKGWKDGRGWNKRIIEGIRWEVRWKEWK